MQVGYDQDYIFCDLVMNWVADNLLLCFYHAIIGEPSPHTHSLSAHTHSPINEHTDPVALLSPDATNPYLLL
jgi:hypothetical protein